MLHLQLFYHEVYYCHEIQYKRFAVCFTILWIYSLLYLTITVRKNGKDTSLFFDGETMPANVSVFCDYHFLFITRLKHKFGGISCGNTIVLLICTEESRGRYMNLCCWNNYFHKYNFKIFLKSCLSCPFARTSENTRYPNKTPHLGSSWGWIVFVQSICPLEIISFICWIGSYMVPRTDVDVVIKEKNFAHGEF
jgi:hypothetical protein